MTTTTLPRSDWRSAYRAWDAPPAAIEPEFEPEPLEFDPALPVFEVWLNGRRRARTQIPARAFRLLHDMHAGRPTLEPPELRIVGDRRSQERPA